MMPGLFQVLILDSDDAASLDVLPAVEIRGEDRLPTYEEKRRQVGHLSLVTSAGHAESTFVSIFPISWQRYLQPDIMHLSIPINSVAPLF